MFEYRVTKYAPAGRDKGGVYRRHEWSSFGDIGKLYGARLFTAEEYQPVEDAYVATALSFWREVGRSALVVRGLENSGRVVAPPDGSMLEEASLADVIRSLLREEFWCRLENEDCYLHFGWDYSMYVGVSVLCSKSCAFAASSGLFVEEFESPYHPNGGS
jgi:hypothetical protein